MANVLGLEIETADKSSQHSLDGTDAPSSANELTDSLDRVSAQSNPEKPKPKDSSAIRTPYVNPERFKTGGSTRDKLTDAELIERMARIREQNEKIKQRRLDVQADEDAFKQSQVVERAKQAKARKVQEDVDRAREQNARRKLDKIQSREWDSGKRSGDWTQARHPTTPSHSIPHTTDTSGVLASETISIADQAAPLSVDTAIEPASPQPLTPESAVPQATRGHGRGAKAKVES